MTYFYLKESKDNCFLLCMIVIIALFFLYIYPSLDRNHAHRREYFANLKHAFDPVDILNLQVFNSACCTNNNKVWPNPIKDDNVELNGYFGSTIQSEQGCACLTKEQVDLIDKCK